MALLFGFGTLFYVCLLFINSIAILHEERFLLKSSLANLVGLHQQAFMDPNSIQARLINIISSVRTLLRCIIYSPSSSYCLEYLGDPL